MSGSVNPVSSSVSAACSAACGYVGVLWNSAKEATFGVSDVKGKGASFMNIPAMAGLYVASDVFLKTAPDAAVILLTTFAAAKLGVSLIGKISTEAGQLRDKFPAVLGNTISASLFSTMVAAGATYGVTTPWVDGNLEIAAAAPVGVVAGSGVGALAFFVYKKCCGEKDPAATTDASAGFHSGATPAS
jgi:predicted TIM-barrel enzyme